MSPTRVFQSNIFQGGGVDPDASKLTLVMDGLDELLSTIVLNHYAYPVESITVPCSVVGFPSRTDFDLVMDRGADTIVVPIYFVCGKTGTKDARDALSSVWANDPGIKAAVDGLHTFGDVRATRSVFQEITVNNVNYMALQYDCEVYG